MEQIMEQIMEQLMKHEIENIIAKNDINMPDFWDVEKVITAFCTLDSFELYEYFGCKNRTSFTRMMKEVFPEREEKSSYSKYVKNLFSDFDISMKHVPEIVTEIVTKHVPEIVTEIVTKHVPEIVTEIVPKHVTEIVTEIVPKHVTEIVTEIVTKHVPEIVTEIVPKHVTEIVTEIVPKHVTEIVTEIVPKHVTEIVPKHVLPEGRNFSDAQIEKLLSLSTQEQQIFLKKCTDTDYKVWKTYKN